jgi:hypothetical protein
MKTGALKNQTGVNGEHPILHCPICGGEFSANSGDYFYLPSDKELTHCGEPLKYVFKRTVYIDAS